MGSKTATIRCPPSPCTARQVLASDKPFAPTHQKRVRVVRVLGVYMQCSELADAMDVAKQDGPEN